MRTGLILGSDVVAILLLVSVYYTRHRRRDLLLAFIGLNIGVLVVATVLASVSVGLGVGLGLFGVLSIIRLRSSVITQEEVAYYFASLALGLVCGLRPDPAWLAPALSALLVLAIAIADLPKFHESFRRQLITLDTVYPSEAKMIEALEGLLNAEIKRAAILETDLVRDQTLVDVSYRLLPEVVAQVAPSTPTNLEVSSDPVGRVDRETGVGVPIDADAPSGVVNARPVPPPPVGGRRRA